MRSDRAAGSGIEVRSHTAKNRRGERGVPLRWGCARLEGADGAAGRHFAGSRRLRSRAVD